MFELDTDKIRAIMLKKALTIREAANLAPITATTLGKILRGGAKVNGKTAGRLAAALGVDPKEILKGE